LELETAIPTVLQNYGVRIFHLPWYLQHFALKLFVLDGILRLGPFRMCLGLF
jgi:hypothetical protein